MANDACQLGSLFEHENSFSFDGLGDVSAQRPSEYGDFRARKASQTPAESAITQNDAPSTPSSR